MAKRKRRTRMRRPDFHLVDRVRGVDVHTVAYAPPSLDASGREAFRTYWFRAHADAVEKQRFGC